MEGDERRRVRETVEGVDIEKRYDDEEFPFPSIVYEISSGREDPVTVRLEDGIPSGVDAGNVGFHRAFGGEHWSIDADQLVFESTIDPGAELKTVYALSAPGTADPDAYFTEPESITVDPPIADADGAPGGEEWVPGGHALETGVDSADRNGPATPTGSGVALGTLARELRTGGYDESDLETLATALSDARNEPGGALEARIDQLEDDISRLRAYTGALEQILDEVDPAVLAGLPERVGDVESDIEDLDEQATELRAALPADLDAELDTLDQRLGSLDDGLDEMRTDIATLEDRLAATDDLEARIAEVERFIDEVQTALG
ncbi:MAG: hypothetical protein ABEH64_07915 [Salinirussus sp.]